MVRNWRWYDWLILCAAWGWYTVRVAGWLS